MTKLFIQESGSGRFIHRMQSLTAHYKVVSELTLLEVRSAVRRRERSGDLSHRDVAFVLSAVEAETRRMRAFPLSSSLLPPAMNLVDRHRLKSLDALQLASALEIEKAEADPLLFVSCDLFLPDAAVSEGLQIWNPEVP